MKTKLLFFTLFIVFIIAAIGVRIVNKPDTPGADVDPLSLLPDYSDSTLYSGPEKFANYFTFIKSRHGASMPEYPSGYLAQEWDKINKSKTRKKAYRDLQFIERGPTNVSGRARDVWLDLNDSTKQSIFVASTVGGLWKSEDGAESWELKTENLPSYAVSKIKGSPSDPNILYLGTGEGYGNNISGAGIFKSIDGGDSFKPTLGIHLHPKVSEVYDIDVDPNNADRFYFIGRSGVRDANIEDSILFTIGLSTDGGDSFITLASSKSGFQQIVPDPTDFNTIYVSVFNEGVVRYNLVTQQIDSLFNGEGLFRMELAISPNNPEVLYILYDQNGEGQVAVTYDRGETFRNIAFPDVEGGLRDMFFGQASYDNTIAVHPFNDQIAFIGGAGPLLEITVPNIDSIVTDSFYIDSFISSVDTTHIDTTLIIIDSILIDSTYKDSILTIIDSMQVDSFYVDSLITIIDSIQVDTFYTDSTSFVLDTTLIDSMTIDSTFLVLDTILIDSMLIDSTFLVLDTVFIDSMLVDTTFLILDTIFMDTSVLVTNPEFYGTYRPIADGYFQYLDVETVGTKSVHVDHHRIVTVPIDSSTGHFWILNCNDGGFAISKDNGETFLQSGSTFNVYQDSDQNTGLIFNVPDTFRTTVGMNSAQFYGADKMNGADRYVGGTQDNGSWLSPEGSDKTSEWKSLPSGDGFDAVWHYKNPDLILESSQFNTIFRSIDRGESWEFLAEVPQGPFFTAMADSKQIPDLFFVSSPEGLHRTVDFGSSFKKIDMPQDWLYSGFRVPTEISLANPLVVWSGTFVSEFSTISLSKNMGTSFESTSPYLEAETGPLTNIITHPIRDSVLYATFSQADGPKVIMTEDYGQTWRDLTGFNGNVPSSSNGFPDIGTYSVLAFPFSDSLLWVGTEFGIFETTDGADSWHFIEDFPAVSVWDMRIVNDEVVISTQGRGVWTVTIPELEGYEPKPVSFSSVLVNMNTEAFGGKVQMSIQHVTNLDSVVVEITNPLYQDSVIFHEIIAINGLADEVFDTIIYLEIMDLSRYFTFDFSFFSYQNGTSLVDVYQVESFGLDSAPVIGQYIEDFEDEEHSLFLSKTFQKTTFDPLDGQAYHSIHPYQENQFYSAVFQKPIIVSDSTHLVTYDEIVFIEPGEPGFLYGNPNFYDAMVIIGTQDLGTSFTILEGYDSSLRDEWASLYVGNNCGTEAVPQSISKDLIFSHTLDLYQSYSEGDTIFLIWSIQSDPCSEGWGFMLDNFSIGSDNDMTTPVNDEIDLKSSYNEPTISGGFDQYINITVSDKEDRFLDIINASGHTLYQHDKYKDSYFIQLDISDYQPGIYFARFIVKGKLMIKRFVKM